MEIFTLEITLAYADAEHYWLRVIEVPENFTIWELHNYIQKIVAFDNDHLYEFYIGKTPRNRTETVSDSKQLNEIYPIPGYKLYYLFDFGHSWLFQIKKGRKRLVADGTVKYPRVVRSTGINPQQYSDDGG